MHGRRSLAKCPYCSDGESSIPLNYRILGPEGSSGSQLVQRSPYTVLQSDDRLSCLSGTGLSPVLSPHDPQGQAVSSGLIYSHCQASAGALWPSVQSDFCSVATGAVASKISGAHLLQKFSKQGALVSLQIKSHFHSSQILTSWAPATCKALRLFRKESRKVNSLVTNFLDTNFLQV